jgi:hypothetical protein
MLLAESPDGVRWSAANLTAPSGVPGCTNCVARDGTAEFGVVYDDSAHAPPSERLKMLWGNTTISVSADGLSWRPMGRWTATSIDPGISVFRNPLNEDEVVVTSRPQALRKTAGRHAGYHSAVGWDALASENNTQALPLDSMYSPTDQFYGLPSFGVSVPID